MKTFFCTKWNSLCTALRNRKETITRKALLRSGLILAIALLALPAILLIGNLYLYRSLPEIEISGQELIGDNGENLKEFTLNEDGSVTSSSTDPWITWYLEEPIAVRNITVTVSSISNEDTHSTRAQIYAFYEDGGYDEQVFTLNEGSNSVTLTAKHAILYLRFDLTTATDVTLSVDSVLINDSSATVTIQGLNLRLTLFWGTAALFFFALVQITYILRDQKKAYREAAVADPSQKKAARKVKRKAAWIFLCSAGYFLCRMLLFYYYWKNSCVADPTFSTEALHYLIIYFLDVICNLALLCYKEKSQSFITGLLLLLFWTLPTFLMVEWSSVSCFSFEYPAYIYLNLLLYLLPMLLLYVVLRRCTLAIGIGSGFFLIMAIINHYYGELRDNPLEWTDILQARTAANVISEYTFNIDTSIKLILGCFAVLLCALFIGIGLKKTTFHWAKLAIGLLSVFLLSGLFYINIPILGRYDGWQPKNVSAKYGYAVSFAGYIRSSVVEKPEDYSVATVNAILEQYVSEDSTGATPNVILIMSESFCDLPTHWGFETNEDPLEYYHSLIGTENVITGTLLSSVYGGGTANTEYEFLTGNSLYTIPVSTCPYAQYLSTKQQSVIWYMKNKGYSTIAFHPYYSNGYFRSSVYPLLGFDVFYSLDSTDLPVELTLLRNYVSDESDFETIIALYEAKDENEPFFIFNVTMQNHGGYRTGMDSIYPLDETLQTATIMEYLSILDYTDDAFKMLFDYFSQVEEDTIILIFGDHQPTQNDLGSDDDAAYLADFIIWANFDIEEASDVFTSPNYLYSMVLEQAGMDLTAYQNFLLTLQESYPAMNMYGYYDSDYVWHDRETAESGSLLWQYQCLSYHNIFDKKNMTSSYFYGN